MDKVLMILIMGILLSLKFLPTIVAVRRKHGNAVPIFLTNLLLGWTIIGWAVALIWAYTEQRITTPPGYESRGGGTSIHR